MNRFSSSGLMAALWIGVLMAYVLGGVVNVPFHGDESTLIYMSRDYAYQFIQRDMAKIGYLPDPSQSPDPSAATQQELRLLNGTFPKYAMGFAWHLAGYTFDDLNEQWLWGADWQYNLTNGHIPTDGLLYAARTSSALMLALGVVVMFGIGHRLEGRVGAYSACAFYALNTVLLLNGRRAMMEGALILFTLLTVLAMIGYLQSAPKHQWKWVIALGVASGMTIASKHTGAMALFALYSAAGLYTLYNNYQQRRINLITWGQLLLTGILALGIFYLLNPAWWDNPLARAQGVLTLRSELLENQRMFFYNYADMGEMLSAFWRNVFMIQPQYYEVDNWAGFIGEQISAYESGVWQGFSSVYLSAGLLVLAIWRVIRDNASETAQKRRLARGVVITWFGITSLLVIILTPFEWQRYYLPAILPLTAVMSLGMGQVVALWQAARA